MTYKIYPVFLGYGSEKANPSRWLYRQKGDEKIEWGYGCFVLKGEDDNCILIDAGIPTPEQAEAYGLRSCPAAGSPSMQDALLTLGVKPEDIKIIILTHLHWDHSWNLDLFSDAKIYVQRKEVRYAIYPAPFEHTTYAIFEDGPRWASSVTRFEPLEGDCEILPGISVMLTPGHSPGGQSVLVNTAEGIYAIIGDFVHLKRGYDDCIPEAIFTSLPDWYEGYEKLRSVHAQILTTHDISTYNKPFYG